MQVGVGRALGLMYAEPRFAKECTGPDRRQGRWVDQIPTRNGTFYAGMVERGGYIKTTRNPFVAAWWILWLSWTNWLKRKLSG